MKNTLSSSYLLHNQVFKHIQNETPAIHAQRENVRYFHHKNALLPYFPSLQFHAEVIHLYIEL